MFKLKSILLSVLLLTGLSAYAQQITVTGVVTSSTDGYGVIGACAYAQRIYGIQKNGWSINNYGGNITVSDLAVTQY